VYQEIFFFYLSLYANIQNDKFIAEMFGTERVLGSSFLLPSSLTVACMTASSINQRKRECSANRHISSRPLSFTLFDKRAEKPGRDLSALFSTYKL
jgi:hypothetical protein